MRILQLFIEIMFIGSLTIIAAISLFSLPVIDFEHLLQNNIIVTFDFLILAWVIGFFINIFSDIFLTPIARSIEARWLLREGNPELVLERLRYDLYVSSANKEVIQRIEYHRSLIRLSRGILFAVILYLLSAIFIASYNHAVLSFIILFVAFSAYYRALIWSIKSIYFAWNSTIKKIPSVNDASTQKSSEKAITKAKADGVNIVAFTGGTGFRDINMSLAKKTQNITRIVPVWDNGGSSKALRECFDIMPVGDIRHALMTQAHGEGRVGSIVKLFNWRLSDSGNSEILLNELKSFVDYQHPLMKSLDHSLGNVIVNYLKHFYETLPCEDNNKNPMDLRNGSIGNFVLVGSYLAHNKDINTAIYVFRQLCSIQGNVWPVSIDNELHLKADLADGSVLIGQSNTTNINREADTAQSKQLIKKISFCHDSPPDKKKGSLSAQANPMVLDAIKAAEVIVFGPGSFFTSILPHLKIEGVVDALASVDATKIFIGNLLEDNECYGYTLEEVIELFLKTCNQHAKIKRPHNRYLTHIIVHQSHSISDYTHNERHYLSPGKNIQRFNNDGISIILNDFENPWKRGGHDPVCIANYLCDINNKNT